MAGAKAEKIVKPRLFVRAASEQHGGIWCEAMKRTSNIIFFVRTRCCKLRNILEIRSAVNERPWIKTQLIYVPVASICAEELHLGELSRGLASMNCQSICR